MTWQMAPRQSLIDDTIFDEATVERAALEMEVDLNPASPSPASPGKGVLDALKKDGAEPNPCGLATLPLVLYFMRAPLPYPFTEIASTSADAEAKTAGAKSAALSSRQSFKAPKEASSSPTLQPERTPPSGKAWVGPKYRNVLNDQVEDRHPLRHVYSRLAKRAEKLAFKRSTPDETSPEAWMEFVDSSGTPYYYCFLTKRREYEFPKLFPVGQIGIATKTSHDTHATRMKRRLLQQPKRRLSPASLEAMRLNMEAEQSSKPRRAAMLNKMPLPVSHIVFTAQYLGIDTLTQSHLMWLASAALCDTLSATLPVGWEQRKIHSVDPPPVLPSYYFNPFLRVAQWEHPSLTHWRSVLAELQACERNSLRALDTSHHGASAAMASKMDGEERRPMTWVTPDTA
jgi:hypothetical protein